MIPRSSISTSLKKANLTDICATALLVIASSVLLGWALEYKPLTSFSWQSDLPTMKGNTAISFLMLGMGLLGLRRGYQPLVSLCGACILLIAGSAQIEYVFDVNLGINDIFFDDKWSLRNHGRMSLASATGFCIASVLLVSHDALSEEHPQLYSVLVLIFLAEPLIAINIYTANMESIIRLSFFSSYSLPTTIAFMLFIIGLIGTTKTGMCGLLHSNDSAAKMFRVWLLILVLGVIIFSAALSALIKMHYLNSSLATALFNTALLLLMLFLMSRSHQRLQLAPAISASTAEKLSFGVHEKALIEVLSASDDGILLVDQRRRILTVNEGTTRIFGWAPEDLIGKPIEHLVPERFRKSDAAQFHNFLLSNERCRNFDTRGKALGLTQRGHEKALAISLYKCKKISSKGNTEDLHVLNDDGVAPVISSENIVYVAAIFRELSGLETEIADFNSRHFIDRLTGLPNHQEFLRYCRQFSEYDPRKSDHFLSILVIDLDNLKRLNERYDREFGDRVLQTITTTLKHRLRTTDKLFRNLKDEFILISVNTPLNEAELMAERMRTSVKVSPTKLDGKNIYVTCSIGVSATNKRDLNLKNCVNQLITYLHETREGERDHVKTLSA